MSGNGLRLYGFAFVSWLLSTSTDGQSIPVGTNQVRSEEALSRQLEALFPVQNEGIDYPALFDNLANMYGNPLDLNRATHDELAALFLLTEQQIASLLAYRAESGAFLAVAELQAVPNFDLPSIKRLQPFVTVQSDANLTGLPSPSSHFLIARYEQVLEEQRGFSAAEPSRSGTLPSRYLGSPGQWYLRYRSSRTGQYSLGFTLEQDPGEQLRWEPGKRQYGPDYVSFHAQLQNRGRWKNIILGDFQQQIGQGLVFSAGFSLGKNAETILTVRRPTTGARPYMSLSEFGYMRGIIATYGLSPRLSLTMLAARNRRDANVANGRLPLTGQAVTSIGTSGLHQTNNDLLDLRALAETNLGGHLLYHTHNGQLGVTVLFTKFSMPLQKRDLPYNAYEFVGNRNLITGLHGSYGWRNLRFFGEIARSTGSLSGGGGVGAVAGLLAGLSRRFDVALLARHYAPNFHSFQANAFGEASRTINEQGLYGGLKYSVYRKLTLSGFVDWFRFPWLKYLVDAPSGGVDYLVSATYLPDRQTRLTVLFHEEHKQKNTPGGGAVSEVVGVTRRNAALTADFSVGPNLQLRSRAQASLYKYASTSAGSFGFALIQDATYQWSRVSLSGRVALFETDDYDSRQYAYERDVLYAFSFPAYFDRGLRHYLMIRYEATKHLDIWLRYARTDLTNQPDIGSGLDLISVPHKTELKMQVRWRF